MVSLINWLFDVFERLKNWFIFQCQLYWKPFILFLLTGLVCEIAGIPFPIEGTYGLFLTGGVLSGIMPPMTSFQNFVFTITYINLWIVIFWIYFIRYNEKHKDD